MTKATLVKCNWVTGIMLGALAVACSPSATKQENSMNEVIEEVSQGTYAYDAKFFEDNKIETIELKEETGAKVLLVPGYQGRVMTSAAGDTGASFGWINYDLIASGKTNGQFNPYGGEERLWLGPEGGPFSVYFEKGEKQTFDQWNVPKEIDTEGFEVVSQSTKNVKFSKQFTLENASGMTMQMAIERDVSILNRDAVENALKVEMGDSVAFVAYESVNSLRNTGDVAWTKDTGFLSIWMLSMFNPSEKGVVFVPFNSGSEEALGKVVTDDYFGKVPSERLIVQDDVVFFKTDGKHRSKIGLSPQRATPYCGSYDEKSNLLTILWYSKSEGNTQYVNSKWGDQSDPLNGDAINSYNDGPVADGSIMGPFYEIESSSPAALLKAGEQMIHKQRIFHITGDENDLNQITMTLFNLSISDIKNVFNDK